MIHKKLHKLLGINKKYIQVSKFETFKKTE